MIHNKYGQAFPTVLAAVADALEFSRHYGGPSILPAHDLVTLQANLDAIIASAACATITPELDGAEQGKAG